MGRRPFRRSRSARSTPTLPEDAGRVRGWSGPGRSGDDSTSVGDALHRAAADLGIEAGGRSFEALAERVVATTRVTRHSRN
jgi:hypothetical protein